MKLTTKDVKSVGLFNSTMQDYKRFGIPKAQLILTDIPYGIGADAYGSNPMWYNGNDNKKLHSYLYSIFK